MMMETYVELDIWKNDHDSTSHGDLDDDDENDMPVSDLLIVN